MQSEDPIKIVGLRKQFGSFVAVDDLTFSVKRNSFTGLLGPNGAGKSTTLKILTNLLRATSGEAYLNGVDVTKDPKTALTGVGTVVETPEFYLYLTPRETMKFIGDLIGMSSEQIKSETEEILSLVNMTEWADNKLGTFSKGMRQRIAIGQSLLNKPNIIILDEPTSGLDPRGMAETRALLKNIRNNTRDLTVIMSSHILSEVRDLCDRITLINNGHMVFNDDVRAFENGEGKRRMILKVSKPITPDMVSNVASLSNVVSAERFGNDIDIFLKGDNDECSTLYSQINDLGIGAYALSEENTLEATYLKYIKESR